MHGFFLLMADLVTVSLATTQVVDPPVSHLRELLIVTSCARDEFLEQRIGFATEQTVFPSGLRSALADRALRTGVLRFHGYKNDGERDSWFWTFDRLAFASEGVNFWNAFFTRFHDLGFKLVTRSDNDMEYELVRRKGEVIEQVSVVRIVGGYSKLCLMKLKWTIAFTGDGPRNVPPPTYEQVGTLMPSLIPKGKREQLVSEDILKLLNGQRVTRLVGGSSLEVTLATKLDVDATKRELQLSAFQMANSKLVRDRNIRLAKKINHEKYDDLTVSIGPDGKSLSVYFGTLKIKR